MKNKKINLFLIRSVVCLIVICIVVFTWLTVFMTWKTNDSIQGVSGLYMSEMNVQLRQKFTSIVRLRLTQVEGIIRRVPQEGAEYGEDLIADLSLSAEVRNLVYLGFFTEDGRMEKIYGKDVEIHDNNIMPDLQNDGNAIGQGFDAQGNKILLLGKTAKYPMADGGTSEALIAGIDMDYLSEALFLNSKDALIYSHIIDQEGKFVIRSADAYRDSYFERIREECGENQAKSAEQYIGELSQAMSEGRDYYMTIIIQGEKREVYCSPISENAHWYLISVMPRNIMDSMLKSLDRARFVMMLCALGSIVAVLLYIFVRYLHMTREQMLELDKARQDAMEANMAKSQFLSNMSHDIRTPMNAIVGMTEIALKNIQDSERVEDCLKKVKLSSKHLLGLINDVLDMSKIESGKMTLNISTVSLRETMDDIVNIIQPQIKAKNQYFDIFIQKIAVEDVCCDSVRLNQVLLNILSNAVKYTQEGGSIQVHLHQEPSVLGEGYIRTHFVIKDNGMGMSEEFQAKIFEAFSRDDAERVSKIQGTGLGMAITKRIVELLGGTIELESELNKGSSFHVALDLKIADMKEDDMRLPPWHILVVDDNEQLCSGAAFNLNELGTNTEWTVDGKEAVRMIEERHRKKDDYQFVLVDWKMPEMDGLQLVREIRKITGRALPIFLISAYDWSDIEEEASQADVEGFISKPLFKSTLYTFLNKYAEGCNEGAKSEEEEKGSSEIDFTGKRVLLAEDIDINWEIADEILSAVGMKPERAENGKICVEKFEQSEIGYYDAVLMDIRMPVMNGYDAAAAIRASNRPDKGLPIIAMTADAFSDDIQHSLDVGMNAHIAKPLDIKELMHVLARYLT